MGWRISATPVVVTGTTTGELDAAGAAARAVMAGRTSAAADPAPTRAASSREVFIAPCVCRTRQALPILSIELVDGALFGKLYRWGAPRSPAAHQR